MERYSSYKPTSMQWLKEIPSHWENCQLGRMAKLKTGGTPKFYLKEVEEEFVEWYTPSDFNESFELNRASRRLNKQDFEDTGISYFPPFSVLIIGIGGTAGKVSYNKTSCYSNQQITAIIPNKKINAAFCTMYFRSIKDYLLATAPYTTLPILNNTYLSGIRILVPPLAEQEKIVSYLESKTSKIDAYVEDKEKEIQLLQELKQKTIAEAVTKGLNSNVKMKDSGISWIGMIPEHWEVSRMKRIFSESKEKTTEESGTLLSLSQYTGITLKENAKKVGMFEAESTIGYNIVHPGQFVMNIMLAWNGSYAVSDYEGIISPSYCVFDFNEDCERKYFHYLLRLPSFAGAFKTMSKGIIESRLRLYPLYFFTFKTTIPPIEEQQAIVAYIDEKSQKIDTLITELQAEIDYLKEYKQRLIADVVTGQVNVQNLI